MILKRAGKEIRTGIDPAAVPHVMAGYASLLISCHCPEHRYLEAQKMRTGMEEGMAQPDQGRDALNGPE